MADALLALEQVSLHWGKQPILRDLTLHIPSGQTVAIIGESGCGKTVLLKLLVGLLRPTTGQVFFAGQNLTAQKPAELTAMRRRVGFLFQGAALFDSLNVYENVAYPLRTLHAYDEATIRTRVRQRLDEVGLASNAEAKMPAELSGGMRKRVGLARALALDPEVMLYDEPTTGLDPIMIEQINHLIVQTRARRPMTSIVVTHEMKTVNAVADRVVMLYPLAKLAPHEPQIIVDAPPASLTATNDERLARFVGGSSHWPHST
jgi:phospholipid/cholesterol/gamma-HCH transport system ATP-binding protein